MSIVDEIREDNRYKIFINGAWRFSKEFFEVISPIDESIVGYVPKASKEDVYEALSSAHVAKKKISKMKAYERAEILHKAGEVLEENADDIVEVLVLEAGKPIKDAKSEVKAGIERFFLASEEIRYIRGEFIDGSVLKETSNRIGFTYLAPVGTVLAITPFNYPFFTPISKIAPAIAVGNSVILKPASDTPISGLIVAKALEKAGLPKGALNVVTGRGKEIGELLVKSEKVDMISLTGNTKTGERVASIAGLKKLQLELGGKAPAIVLEDADIELASKEIVKGALSYSGQRCNAVSRVIVVEEVADELVKSILEEMEKYKFMDLRDERAVLSPLINKKAVEKVKMLVEDAINKGAKLVKGFKIKGLYFEPTLLDHVKRDMLIAREETFGPVIPIIRVSGFEEAIELANDVEYGLDACIFTENIKKALKAAMLVRCGAFYINTSPKHGHGLFPFGGVGKSGLGREGIKYSILEMGVLKSVSIRID